MSISDYSDAAGTTGAASDTADRAGEITHLQGAKVTGSPVQDEGRPDPARLTNPQWAALVRQDLDHAISDGAITLPQGAKVIVHTEWTAVLRDGKHRPVTSLVFTIRDASDEWAYLPAFTDGDRYPSHEAMDLAVELIELGVKHRAPSSIFRHLVQLAGGPRLTAT